MSGKSVITIDGPSGAGKSTVARRLAERIRFSFLDSGAVYRAATWFAISRSVRWDDESEILGALDGFSLRLEERPSGMLVFVNSRDVTGQIRGRDISNNIYHLADNPRVRIRLVPYQRAFAEGKKIVAEGRDMGTVVFPDADLKIYLDASLEIRARRRQMELAAQGEAIDLSLLIEEIRTRDERDMTRAVAPLCKPPGAFFLDASPLPVEEVLEILIREASKKQLV